MDHQAKNQSFSHPRLKVISLPAEVIEVRGNSLTISVVKPPPVGREAKLALQLAQSVIENTYLLEGQITRFNHSKVEIDRIAGAEVRLRLFDKSHRFKTGDRSEILLAKKTIAIKDFEVIMGQDAGVAKYVQEDVTTALVNSGQFNVVERSKLKSILDELKLAQTGLLDSDRAKQVGTLLGADVILTGTLALVGHEWNVNLRVINTDTGLITAALNKTAPLHELHTAAFREFKNIDGTFENETSDMAGWVLGEFSGGRMGAAGYKNTYIDKTQGAAGTHRCLVMDFKLGLNRVKRYRHQQIIAGLTNRLKRDLGNYSGIRFFIKADRDMTVWFQVADSQEGSDYEENWFRNIPVTIAWQETRIPFNSLSIQKGRAQKQGTNQILQLNLIERINWLVKEQSFRKGEEARIWLDEVSFY